MYRARKWWQPAEIASVLGVTKWAVNNWIRQGKLKATKPSPTGKHQRVWHEDFEAFVRQRMASGAKGAAVEALTVGWMRKGAKS